MPETWIVVGYLKEVLCAVGRMESYMGSVFKLKMLQSLDARLSGLECGRGQLRALGHLGMGKRVRENVDIWDLYNFLLEKESQHSSLGLRIKKPEVRTSHYFPSNNTEDIEIWADAPQNGRYADNTSGVYIQVHDRRFRLFVQHHFFHNIQPNKSDKMVVDDSKVHFQSIRDYEDIESVWRELKILFELDPSW